MNPAYTAEEETKTIKYINKGNQNSQDKDQPSESPTEKVNPKPIAAYSQGNRSNKHSKQFNERVVTGRKMLNGQIQKKVKDEIQSGRHPNNGHKKGKSMDLQQLLINKKNEKRLNGQNQISKQKYKKYSSNEINACIRDRNSISQMKHYNYQSKRLNNLKKTTIANQCNTKRKKPKTINEGDFKQIQRELKKLIDQTPVPMRFKKKNGSKFTQKSNHNNSCTLNNQKRSKKYGKSQQILIYTEQKRNKRVNIEKEKYRFEKESFTMPLTQRIISLFSNPSSVYNSRKQLEVVKNGRPFIIPTQQSVQQIIQIREYENVSLRKSNSNSLRHLKKLSPLRQKVGEDSNANSDSTLNIVKLYLQKFRDMHEHSLSRQLQQISFIPQITRQKSYQVESQMADSLNLAQIHNIKQDERIKMQSSEVIKEPENTFLLKQEQEIRQLDGLIKQLQKSKGESLQQGDKRVFLQKIRELIENSGDYNQRDVNVKKVQEIKKNEVNFQLDLNNSSLKQSITQDQQISQLNLQVLDNALRQRQKYLTQRKEKQLQKLEEQLQKPTKGKIDEQNIIKWIDHQIKEVIHTRQQLWKGFYFAKNILKDPSIEKTNEKKKKMMKCLSDKYIKNKSVNSIKTKGERQEWKESKNNDKKQVQPQQLSQGRITESPFKKQKCVQSESDELDFKESSQDNQSQQLLIRPQNSLNQFLVEKQEHTSIQRQHKQKNNIYSNGKQDQLKKSTNLSFLGKEQLQKPQSIGLNILQIECELEQQESYNQQQLNALVKESQQIKKESFKIPLNLAVQDKQDIFEFIFLDLCIQLTDQYKNDSPLMTKIYAFIRSMKQQSKKQKGFKTNSNAIKEYLYQLVSFLKNKTQLLQQIHINIDKPLGPTAIDILKYMHVYEQEPMQEESNQTVFIMDLRVFQTFQNVYLAKLEFETYYQDEEKEKKRKNFLKNAIHIHNKAIFDALNQNLDKERPFGVWGEPFSWKKIAKFYHQRSSMIKNNLILKCTQKTIESASYMCGFMVDKQDCTFKGNPNITQSYVDQIRDDRLSRMLANELQESQEKMLFIDDEETQILVEVGLVIFQSLLNEAAKQLLYLQ